MKFTYWSGNKKELEKSIKDREETLVKFAESGGLDISKIKVSFNYKDQSKKTKESKKVIDFSSYKEQQSNDRGELIESANGSIAVRLNDKAMEKKIDSRISAVPMTADEAMQYAADIEVGVVADYLALAIVQKDPRYSIMEDGSLLEVKISPLFPLFAASALKLETEDFYKGVKVVSDPYMYELAESMTEADWRDLFDICNYHRIQSGLSFGEVSRQVYGDSHINSTINSIIEQLEALYLEYKSMEIPNNKEVN